MKHLNYYLQGFGFNNVNDYVRSTFPVKGSNHRIAILGGVLGSLRMFLHDFAGMDIAVFVSFVVLIVAEFHTGVKVDRIKRKNKFQSRKAGRMIFKVGTYMLILVLLNSFAKGVDFPQINGFDVNPFQWLYYAVFITIVFQLFISWLENLSCLGYKESATIIGVLLKKFNKWFELDGSKNQEIDQQN